MMTARDERRERARDAAGGQPTTMQTQLTSTPQQHIITLTQRFIRFEPDEGAVSHWVWIVHVESTDGAIAEEPFADLDAALAYVRDVAVRPLRPFNPNALLAER